MSMIIRTAFNNQGWKGRCINADRDRRLFQCKQNTVNTSYGVGKDGRCTATCWESSLCTRYSWDSAVGDFGEKAYGKVYFVYTDVDKTLVLWGHSTVKKRDGSRVFFKPFSALSEFHQIRGLTYGYLTTIGVPIWKANTFRYISEQAANKLDNLLEQSRDYFEDPSEPFSTIEGRKKLSTHLAVERSTRLVHEFKASLRDFKCSVCGFDFLSKYGEIGEGFIEAHHVKTLASMKKGKPVSIKDLVPVCSNCHRMLHKNTPPLTIKSLIKLINEQIASRGG